MTFPQGGGIGFQNTGTVIANYVVIFGTHGSLLVYNGTPAAGNLIASIAAEPGTDAYGNTYLQGITNYLPGLGRSVQIDGGAIAFNQGGLSPGEIEGFTTGVLELTSPQEIASDLQASLILTSKNESDFDTAVIETSSFTSFLFGNEGPFWLQPSGDTSGSTDYTAITAILAAVIKNLTLLPGTFYFDNQVTVLADYTLGGSGVDVTVINNLDSAAHGFYADNLSNLTFENFTLAGPGDVAGSNDGIHLDGTSALNNIKFDSIKVREFGNYGIFANDIITSSLRNVEVQQVAEHGIVFQNGTSVQFAGTYVNNVSGYGYFLNGMSYCNFNGAACDFGQWGYYLEGCYAIAIDGSGCESQTIGGLNINGCTGVTATGFEVYKNPGIGCYVNNDSTGVVLVGFVERSPTAGATASIQVDAGSSATIIEPVYVTAPIYNGNVIEIKDGVISFWSGGSLVYQINSTTPPQSISTGADAITATTTISSATLALGTYDFEFWTQFTGTAADFMKFEVGSTLTTSLFQAGWELFPSSATFATTTTFYGGEIPASTLETGPAYGTSQWTLRLKGQVDVTAAGVLSFVLGTSAGTMSIVGSTTKITSIPA